MFFWVQYPKWVDVSLLLAVNFLIHLHNTSYPTTADTSPEIKEEEPVRKKRRLYLDDDETLSEEQMTEIMNVKSINAEELAEVGVISFVKCCENPFRFLQNNLQESSDYVSFSFVLLCRGKSLQEWILGFSLNF